MLQKRNTLIISKLPPPIKPTRTALTPLCEALGAKFNDATGFYELNGLTDITEEQMGRIYSCTAGLGGDISLESYGWLKGTEVRTNFQPAIVYSFNLYLNSGTEVLNLIPFGNYYQDEKNSEAKFSDNSYYKFSPGVFYNCLRLRRVIGVIDIKKASYNANYYFPLPSLERIIIRGVHTDFALFSQAPKLNAESVSYMVNNATNTGAITITVHKDVYAKLTDPNNVEWSQILTAAQAKQITFAVSA